MPLFRQGRHGDAEMLGGLWRTHFRIGLIHGNLLIAVDTFSNQEILILAAKFSRVWKPYELLPQERHYPHLLVPVLRIGTDNIEGLSFGPSCLFGPVYMMP